MKKAITLILLAAVSLLLGTSVSAGYVNGYYRKNGTYVAPHYRKDPVSRSTGGTSSYSTSSKGSTSYNSSSVKLPKSYEVYQQRQTQGPRTFSKGLKQRKYNEQGGKCPHCGKQCTYGEMEGDHVVPYSKGGKTEYSNLQMLCAPCNRSKGNRYSH